MAIRKVARMGHPVLRQMATEVPAKAVAGPEMQRLIDDLLETVREYDGAGLAAPQVHVSLRVVVLQLDSSRGFDVWINPVITPLTEDLVCTVEGCLSVPELRGIVCRPGAVQVEALDRYGKPVVLELSGFPAVVAQHECDHLDGVLFVDRVEPQTLSFLEEFRRFADQYEEE
jgi:peptide deformylase